MERGEGLRSWIRFALLIIAEHWNANKVVSFVGNNEARDTGSRKCTELTVPATLWEQR